MAAPFRIGHASQGRAAIPDRGGAVGSLDLMKPDPAKVGEFCGIEIWTDPKLGPDEARMVVTEACPTCGKPRGFKGYRGAECQCSQVRKRRPAKPGDHWGPPPG